MKTAIDHLSQRGNQRTRAGLKFFMRTPFTVALVFAILHGCAFRPPDSTVEPGFKPAATVASPLAIAQQPMDAPSIRAKSAIMIDAQSGKTLYEKNADERLSVASTQKLLTAMEVIAEGGLEQDVQVTIWDQLQPPTKLGLIAGTSHRRLDLLGAMLVSSANDAASALANAADGSYGDFISRMNARADRLGAKHSLFLNPHGLDMPGQHSTARDAAIIAYHAYRVPLIRHFAAQEMIPFSYGDGRTILLENTNILLWNRPAYFNGLKSGFTIEGGKCLVASAKHRGREILIVLLASTQEEVFRDAKRLFRWYEKQVKTNATGDAPPAR
jgi:D-alanyl-D-alanine carboxypeptidase (penicillin-binding protein 5/6)